MKILSILAAIVLFGCLIISCSAERETLPTFNIIFLHHSTGQIIWNGKTTSVFGKIMKKINPKLAGRISNKKAFIPLRFKEYNKHNSNADIVITEKEFPKAKPYGWNNNPFDYYNIWVKNAGELPFMDEPTLEMLTKEYQMIIFKHCFPVCNIQEDEANSDIDSYFKTLANYKLQYLALRNKLHTFTDTRFILVTGAAQVKANIREDEALRAKEFFKWVVEEWDRPNDNIYLWDLYTLQTDGELYFKQEYAFSQNDSHPNKKFAERASDLFFKRIIDIIETSGKKTSLTGESILITE